MSAEGRTREIRERRRALVSEWPEAWPRMIDRWRREGPDAAWLMYSASYLLRTGGVRWAIDPVTLRHTVPEAARVSVGGLAALRFVMLTHGHHDHIDTGLLRRLAQLDHLQWLIPPHCQAVAKACGVPDARVVVPRPEHPVEFGPVRVTVFDGLHWEYHGGWGDGDPVSGIESSGCLAEWDGKRVLFPGDTRTYDTSAFPALGGADTVFAHVWLGRGAALDPEPPCLDAFCSFAAALGPTRRVVLTHLEEVSREPTDYWNRTHAGRVRNVLTERLPAVRVHVPTLWSEIEL